MIRLYTATTPNGRKVSIALEEMGLPYEVQALSLKAMDQKTPAFLAINPNGRIPAIVDDGFPVFESGAILVYLAQKTGMLMGKDAQEASVVLQWLMWQMGGLGPMQGQANVFFRYFPEKIPAAIDRYQNETRRLYGVMDGHLAERKWLAGEYSIADIACYPWVAQHEWSGIDLAPFPHLSRWFAELGARPAVQRGMAVPAPVRDAAAIVETAQTLITTDPFEGKPMTYRWPNGARLALSLVVNVEEGAEQNIDDGDKGPEPVDELQAVPGRKAIRAHAAASSYQYGIKEGAARVRRVLDEAGAKATWTAAGLALERAPDLAKAIVARGDEIACHGLRWIPQFEMDEEAERAFIRGGADAIERVAGVRPRGWLSRYLFTDNTRRILLEEGYDYHMDDFSADAPFWDVVTLRDGTRKPLAILPYAVDTNDMKFWLTPAFSPADWLSYAKQTLDWLLEEGENQPRMMSVGTHLRIIGRPGRIGAYRDFIAYAQSRPGVWIATRAEIADAFTSQVAAPTDG